MAAAVESGFVELGAAAADGGGHSGTEFEARSGSVSAATAVQSCMFQVPLLSNYSLCTV
jgi:hypothetical protein